MIHLKPDGGTQLSFEDWSPEMMLLATLLHQLPAHPHPDIKRRDHELGIDALAKATHGPAIIEALFRHVDQLEHCPTGYELIAIGKAWLAHKAEMELFRRRRASQGRREKAAAQQQHVNAQARPRRQPTPAVRANRFTRGN